ncbi:MAG: 30S ribosomal protein S18 [Alphaproteobacteria bacterium]|nr:30S ribosomal protein S18 [Alphaproteobacteria bacterium]
MTYQNKRVCFFKANNIQYVDYRDIELMQQFLSPHGKLIPRKKTGTSASMQRKLSLAVKYARYMGLLPYIR